LPADGTGINSENAAEKAGMHESVQGTLQEFSAGMQELHKNENAESDDARSPDGLDGIAEIYQAEETLTEYDEMIELADYSAEDLYAERLSNPAKAVPAAKKDTIPEAPDVSGNAVSVAVEKEKIIPAAKLPMPESRENAASPPAPESGLPSYSYEQSPLYGAPASLQEEPEDSAASIDTYLTPDSGSAFRNGSQAEEEIIESDKAVKSAITEEQETEEIEYENDTVSETDPAAGLKTLEEELAGEHEYDNISTSDQVRCKEVLSSAIRSEDKLIIGLSGEEGFGKSTVLKYLFNDLINQNYNWLWGECSANSQISPFGIFQEMLLTFFNCPNYTDLNKEFENTAKRNEFSEGGQMVFIIMVQNFGISNDQQGIVNAATSSFDPQSSGD
jgi:hypothetical protein